MENNNSTNALIFNKDASNQKKRPFLVDNEEYPFKSNWYDKDGVSMHYIDEGEGIPIVLAHGNPEWSFIYRNIIKELSGEARLIAYDLPGFGFSDTPKDFDYTPQEHAKWVKSLVLDHLKLEKFILVVQDWGGPTALHLATNHPNRILGTVISNTWAWKANPESEKFSNFFKTEEGKRLIYEENYFVRTLLLKSMNKKSGNNQAIINAYEMAFPTPESRKGTLIFPQHITLSESWFLEIEEKLHLLADKPVELIFGEKNRTLGNPESIAKWRSYYPNANVQLLPNADHFTQEESPESFVFALRRILKEHKNSI